MAEPIDNGDLQRMYGPNHVAVRTHQIMCAVREEAVARGYIASQVWYDHSLLRNQAYTLPGFLFGIRVIMPRHFTVTCSDFEGDDADDEENIGAEYVLAENSASVNNMFIPVAEVDESLHRRLLTWFPPLETAAMEAILRLADCMAAV